MWELRITLILCSFVCRHWRDYVGNYSSKPIEVPFEELLAFGDTVRQDRRISSQITRLKLRKNSATTPVSSFVMDHQLPNLDYLNIHELDLAREHQRLYGALLFPCVQDLRLYRLQSCQLSQLVRFINAFPSLLRLDLDFAFNRLEHKGRILPNLGQNYNLRSLMWLQLDLIPGVSGLVHWLLEKQFLGRLETLALSIRNTEDLAGSRSSVAGVGRLLQRCCATVSGLSLLVSGVPMIDTISDIGERIALSLYCFFSYVQVVQLSQFRNLSVLTYSSNGKGYILPYAVRQLQSTSWNTCITKIVFDICLDPNERHLDRDLCRALDNVLREDRFSVLGAVLLHSSISFLFFPRLNNARMLGVLPRSRWIDLPVQRYVKTIIL